MSAENPVSDLDTIRFRGDSASVSIPLVNPSTGAAYDPAAYGPLLFTLKASDDQSEASLVEKLSNVGGITLANPAVVTFVEDDFSALSVGVTYWLSIRDTSARITVARGTLKFDSPIADSFELTIPTTVVDPASPYLSAEEIEANRAAAEQARDEAEFARDTTAGAVSAHNSDGEAHPGGVAGCYSKAEMDALLASLRMRTSVPMFVGVSTGASALNTLSVSPDDAAANRVYTGLDESFTLVSYRAAAGTDAEDLPGIVHPANYDAGTNAVVFIQCG